MVVWFWVFVKRYGNLSAPFLFWVPTDINYYCFATMPPTLAQRNGTTQQIFRLYNTYTDASNYERLTLTGVAGTSVNITAETLGTGGDNLDIVLTPAGTGAVKFGTSWQFIRLLVLIGALGRTDLQRWYGFR
jgi:hypothetical protein